MLDPLTECLTPEVARRIVALRADETLQARLDELADKNTEGQITPAELREYDAYVHAIGWLTILQSRARRYLAQANQT